MNDRKIIEAIPYLEKSANQNNNSTACLELGNKLITYNSFTKKVTFTTSPSLFLGIGTRHGIGSIKLLSLIIPK